jgi:hypothetical protein
MPLLARAFGHLFVGPDHGLFGFVRRDCGARLYRIRAEEIAPVRSRTFEARDLFAVVAGALAAGEDPAAFGDPLRDLADLPIPEPVVTRREVRGVVLSVDRFGNLVTNVPSALVPPEAEVRVAGRKIGLLRSTYAEVPEGRAVALVGSGGFLEVSVRNGSAARRFRAKRGTPVRLKGGSR